MIKCLICFLLGHKCVLKAYTGHTMKSSNGFGVDLTIALYDWRKMPFCVRCGKPMP